MKGNVLIEDKNGVRLYGERKGFEEEVHVLFNLLWRKNRLLFLSAS